MHFKKILKFGWKNFIRDKGLSLQAIFIFFAGVLICTSLFFFGKAGAYLISQVQEKIDVAVYFKGDTKEQDILAVKNKLLDFVDQVSEIDYISQAKALETFTKNHSQDQIYLKALAEIEDNPLLASLNIKAKEPGQYAQISEFLAKSDIGEMINSISYYKNKDLVDRVFSIIHNVKMAGFGAILILVFLVAVIIFNVIKLSIISAKDEIATMRIVGASNWFIRGPFWAQVIISVSFSVVAVDVLFFLFFLFYSSSLSSWFSNIDFLSFFLNNIGLIFLAQIFSASLLGVFSASMAMRKYLKI